MEQEDYAYARNYADMIQGAKQIVSMKEPIVRLFILIVSSLFWTACSGMPNEDNAGKTTYSFLGNAGSAEINAGQPEYVKLGETEFTINADRRVVLFEHPNSEVVFKHVPVGEKARLQFGIGINQDAWDKPGDGVLFEVIIVDERSRKISALSKYIDPKKNAGDRKWFDHNVDLQAFAGQEVSVVFKTTGGPESNVDYDWAGWSNPQVISGGKMGWVKQLLSILR